MRLLILSLFGRLGPSSRHRVYQFLPLLEQRGFDCDVFPLFDDETYQILLGTKASSKAARLRIQWTAAVTAPIRRVHHALNARNYDAVYIQKDVLMFPARQLLPRFNPRIVFDLDDALFAPHPTLTAENQGFLKRLYLANQRKGVEQILRMAKGVMVSTPYLAEYARRFNSNVHNIGPGPVDCRNYYRPRPPKERPEFIIGWIGSPTTTPFLRPIIPALGRVLEQLPQARIRVVGGIPFDTGGVPLEWRNWTLETERDELADFDVGLMPLAQDDYSKGKAGFKVLQYFAMEKPVVCSTGTVDPTMVVHGSTGFLAGNEEEWIGYLRQLAEDPPLRNAMGQRGRLIVQERYSVERACATLIKLLEEATGRNTP